jgi:hypothetical protein
VGRGNWAALREIETVSSRAGAWWRQTASIRKNRARKKRAAGNDVRNVPRSCGTTLRAPWWWEKFNFCQAHLPEGRYASERNARRARYRVRRGPIRPWSLRRVRLRHRNCVGGIVAPKWAGFTKLTVQTTKGGLGNMNPRVYQLGAIVDSSRSGLRDVAAGHNSMACRRFAAEAWNTNRRPPDIGSRRPCSVNITTIRRTRHQRRLQRPHPLRRSRQRRHRPHQLLLRVRYLSG